MFFRTLSTTLLQIFRKSLPNSNVISKCITGPDDTCQGINSPGMNGLSTLSSHEVLSLHMHWQASFRYKKVHKISRPL